MVVGGVQGGENGNRQHAGWGENGGRSTQGGRMMAGSTRGCIGVRRRRGEGGVGVRQQGMGVGKIKSQK